LNHEPHEPHERWRGVAAFVPSVGTPSDPRLCRALGASPLRVAFARAGSASELATPSQTRPRSDGSGWGRRASHPKEGPDGTAPCRPSHTPVSKQGSVEQARLQNRDLLSSPGRRMPDGWTRQRPRTAVSKLQQDYHHGGSPFVGFVWFVVMNLLSTANRLREADSADKDEASKVRQPARWTCRWRQPCLFGCGQGRDRRSS